MGWGERQILRGKGGEGQPDGKGQLVYPSQGRCLGLGYDQGPGLGLQSWSSQGGLCGCLWLWSSLGAVQGLVVWVPPGVIVMSESCVVYPRTVALGYMPAWVACTAPWGHADNLTGAAAKIMSVSMVLQWMLPGATQILGV